MDHTSQNQQHPGGRRLAESPILRPVTNGSPGVPCRTCVDAISSDPAGPGNHHSMPAPPVISADTAARALRDHFLANADRGDNAANDELVAELAHRIRARRAYHKGRC